MNESKNTPPTGTEQHDITTPPGISGASAPAPAKRNPLKVAGLVLGALVLLSGSAFASMKAIEALNADSATDQTANESASKADTPAEKPQDNPEAASRTALIASERALADKLRACMPVREKFTHLLTTETLDREIKGLEGDLCVYEEGMPNNGLMTCRYTEAQRIAVADYRVKYIEAESAQSSTRVESDGTTESNDTIDGESIENPSANFFNDGTCTVSGY